MPTTVGVADATVILECRPWSVEKRKFLLLLYINEWCNPALIKCTRFCLARGFVLQLSSYCVRFLLVSWKYNTGTKTSSAAFWGIWCLLFSLLPTQTCPYLVSLLTLHPFLIFFENNISTNINQIFVLPLSPSLSLLPFRHILYICFFFLLRRRRRNY